MANQAEQSRQLLVVLDPDFGERLNEVRPDQPVWIVESVLNTPAVKALWAAPPEDRCLTALTSFKPKEQAPEREVLAQLDMIDLHHGQYSSQTPYTMIEVTGASLTDEIRAALRKLGFKTFKSTRQGFTSHRSELEAHALRRDLV